VAESSFLMLLVVLLVLLLVLLRVLLGTPGSGGSLPQRRARGRDSSC
jgi:hypothetical protein